MTTREGEVTESTVQRLKLDLNKRQNVVSGERGFCEGLDWRADILIKDAYTRDILMAIECKGSKGVRRGVGQALSYQYILGKAGIAAYDMTETQLSFVEQLPLYCFNVTGTKPGDVEIASKPDSSDNTGTITIEKNNNEVIAERKQAKDEIENLNKEIERLKRKKANIQHQVDIIDPKKNIVKELEDENKDLKRRIKKLRRAVGLKD